MTPIDLFFWCVAAGLGSIFLSFCLTFASVFYQSGKEAVKNSNKK